MFQFIDFQRICISPHSEETIRHVLHIAVHGPPAVRIAVRENGRQSFEDYIREQVAACSRSSVVPDHTLLHLTFPDSKAIPSRRSTTNEYFYGKLAPAFIRQDIHPEPAVSLRDAAFALSKGLSPLSPAGRREQLMRDSEYRRFTMHCARTAPDDAPLYRAVTSSQGTYLFSDTPMARRPLGVSLKR